MKYKEYPKYKNSSLKWFDKIPEQWEIYKLKFLISSLESGKRKDFENEDYALSLGGEHINWNGTLNLNNKRYLSKEYYDSMNKGKINENDVLLVKDGATIGKTAIIEKLPKKMAVNEHVFIIRKNQRIISKLLYYLISSNLGFTQIKLTETGSAQPGINLNIADETYFTLTPNLNEQKQIANYLDKKTSTIEENITKNKKLIELLKEKRTALINQTVTKGLNPDTPMKESGIKWIGKIPEHWKCRKISSLSNIKRGASPRPIDDPIYFDENGKYSWVRISNVTSSNKYLMETDQKLSKLGKSLSAPLEPGSIFISIAATVGKPIITKIKCCVHDGFVYFENLNINEEFLYYIFEGGEPYKGLGKLGTQLNLNRETIGQIYVPLPPVEEQKQISKYLDKKTEQIDKTIEKIERNIELLEEYKESLIHHIVTGKVDVRGVEV
ncbi:MAG: restriction endonuclease subunit S [Methanosphaera stadtmanae]|nr:restriction endonuclease subunit S [Methanosphaera stadtmanae]